MTFTLNDLMIGAYRRAGLLNVGTLSTSISSGSPTSFKDESLATETSDDDFNNGTFFFIRGSTLVNGQFRRISDYVSASGEFTLSAAITLATGVSSGVTYGYTTPELGQDLMIELANDSLQSIGDFVFIDKNTITSSAAQTEYQMETAWKRSKPIQIDLQTDISSTALRNAWEPVTQWEYEPASAGSTAGRIIFGRYLPVGRKLRIWYEGPHAQVTTSSAAIDERIHPELAVALLVERMYEYRNSRTRGAVPWDVQRWNDAKVTAQQMRLLHPVWRPKRRSKRLELDGSGDTGDHLPYPSPYGPS
jgi:hypothetical protein